MCDEMTTTSCRRTKPMRVRVTLPVCLLPATRLASYRAYVRPEPKLHQMRVTIFLLFAPSDQSAARFRRVLSYIPSLTCPPIPAFARRYGHRHPAAPRHPHLPPLQVVALIYQRASPAWSCAPAYNREPAPRSVRVPAARVLRLEEDIRCVLPLSLVSRADITRT